MILVWLLFLAALSLEGIGTYISVIGLSAAFAADPIILTMAVVLDFSKIIAVSALSKRWNQLTTAIKSYLVVATLVLMTITSSGVAGYLSNSFQKAMLPNQGNTIVLENLNKEQVRLVARKTEIDKQISQLPANNVRGRQKLMDSFKPETAHINERLIAIETELPKLQTAQTVQNTEVGPILFLAQLLGITPEKAVSIVIAMIIFVFDPLSIVFLIAGNRLLNFREKEKKEEREVIEAEDVKEPEPEPEPTPVEVDEWDFPEVEPTNDWVHHEEDHPPLELMPVDPDPVTKDYVDAQVPDSVEVVVEDQPEPVVITFDPPVVELEEEVEIPQVIIPPAPVQPPPETLDDVLKSILKDRNSPLTAEENEHLNKALDRIFAEPTREASDEPDDDHEVVAVPESTPLPEVRPDEGTLVHVDEDMVAEPEFINSLLHDPSLDRMAGANSEFVGPHWINPKLLEIYSDKPQ